jgi:flagellar biosynthesis protein FlhB
MADDSDRVIPATPRRREAARAQGLLPTASLPAWVATAGTAVLLLPAWAAATTSAATDLVRESLAAARPGMASPLVASLPAVLAPTLAVVLASAVAGLAVRFALDGFSWHPQRALPSWSRIDVVAGLARVVSGRTLTSAAGAGLGLAVVATSAAVLLAPLLAVMDAAQAAAAAWRAIAWLIAAAAVVAVAAWAAARRRFERRIRMTPEEFAAEAKSVQADPKVRLLQQQRRRTAQPAAGAA